MGKFLLAVQNPPWPVMTLALKSLLCFHTLLRETAFLSLLHVWCSAPLDLANLASRLGASRMCRKPTSPHLSRFNLRETILICSLSLQFTKHSLVLLLLNLILTASIYSYIFFICRSSFSESWHIYQIRVTPKCMILNIHNASYNQWKMRTCRQWARLVIIVARSH